MTARQNGQNRLVNLADYVILVASIYQHVFETRAKIRKDRENDKSSWARMADNPNHACIVRTLLGT